ncbi:SIT4 protein phosphatase-associated protein [Scheffersomyces amazonensis]|uniref:SIT4 protein phosphatase-associated protein n=1 Tax=Scheffersomyces amazonensis TaxID=1078765 RepID=UPI00315D7DF1
MSFWPFTNSLNSNNQLQKFLDGVVDFSSISVNDIFEDSGLSQELISELHNIKGNFKSNITNFSLSQQLQSSDLITNGQTGTNSDVVSLTSSNTDNGGTGSTKDSRGVKLVELLLQPHILNGLLDFLVDSVDYFHDQTVKELEELEKSLNEGTNHLASESESESETESESESESEVRSTLDQNDSVSQTHIEEDEDDDTNSKETKDEKFRRCVQAASDILSIDLWIISNRIIETPSIMSKLWQILRLDNLKVSSPTVNYLIHILDQLMDTNSIELLNFIRRQDDLVDTFLEKVEIPMLMDFFLRIIQTDKPQSPTGIIETLSSQNLIPKLIEILKPHPSQFVKDSKIPNHDLFFKQTASTDFIKALVTISSNTALAVVLETNIGPNQLTRELVSPPIIKSIINDIMLYKPPSPSIDDNNNNNNNPRPTNKHGISNCVGIIIELIRKNNSDYDLYCGSYGELIQNGENGPSEVNSFVMFQWLKDFDQNPPGPRDPVYLGDMLTLFSENLDKFAELLDENPIPPDNVIGEVLGFTRFKISELVAELLHCSNMILLNSKKIKKIIKIRDHIRSQQKKRIKKALNETIDFPEASDESIQDVTMGLDDVSLDDIHFENESSSDGNYRSIIESLDAIEDSEDEEPAISPENPFVCEERDQTIRLNPCIGDYFKIKLIDSKILLDVITMFTQFPWHNFFHNVVFDLIQQIFNGKLNSYNSFLIVELFKPDKCNLIDLIVEKYKEDIEPKPGYRGHLILISEEIVKFTSLYKPDLISPIIVDAISLEEWDWFVEEVLLKTREVYNVVLGAEPEESENGKIDGDAFDASTVGYLDLDSYENNNKNLIILGDSSNHELFIHDKSADHDHEDEDEDDDHDHEDEDEDDEDDDDDDDSMDELDIPDVRIQNMSPTGNIGRNENRIDDEYDHRGGFQTDYHENDFLEHLSGSSSSDDEDDEHSNELRRVPKHNE